MTSRWRIAPSEGPYTEYDGKKGANGAFQCVYTDDIHHALHIVGEHMQTHLGTDMLERPGEEMV